MSRFTLDTSTGTSDLAWNLVLIFFLTSFLSAQSAQGIGVPLPGTQGRAVRTAHVTLPSETLWFTSPISLDALRLTNGQAFPDAPEDTGMLLTWLSQACGAGVDPLEIALQCLPEAPYRTCVDLAREIQRATPGCTVLY